MKQLTVILALWLPLTGLTQTNLPGLLIEAENFSRKEPAKGDFARPAKNPSCSGGEYLVRFHEEGRCYYGFTVPAGGLYRGWLRYARRTGDGTIAITLNGKEMKAPLPATGSLEGAGAWKWTKLFEQNLSPGKHTLVLRNAAIRPDCIFISTVTKPPEITKLTDVTSSEALPADVQAKLAKPIEPVFPDWLKDCSRYQLPRWYDEVRVCAHTRLSSKLQNLPIFFQAGQAIASLGFKQFARHIKSGDEAAWWPSRVGAVQDWAKNRNVAKELIDDAHKNRLRIMVYHRHMEDGYMAKQHPDWVCVGPGGKYLHTKRGDNLCFNSPYVDYLIQRQLELVDLGADAFYYDEVHMPKSGCWCRFCKEKFKVETGVDHPTAVNPADPVYRKLIEFNNATIERAFLRIRRALHARNPEVVMLIGSNTYPGLGDPHLSHRLFRIADAMKTEFSLPARPGVSRVFSRDATLKPIPRDIRIGMGYALSRDATDGRPPHVWCHGLLDSESACFATAGMIAHGCVANLDNNEREIPNPALFKDAVALGNRVAPAFAGMRPLHWAAVHFSELARNRHLPNESAAWKQVIYPSVGAYQALSRARLPVRVLTDSHLEEGALDGYRVLFLPAPKDLTGTMRQNVAKFKAAGGLVIEQQPSWEWHDPNGGQEKATAEFLRAITGESVLVPVQALGGPPTMHCESYVAPDRKRLTVALVNDFSWVATGTQGNEDQADEPRQKRAPQSSKRTESEPVKTKRPSPCQGVTVVLRVHAQPKQITNLMTGQTLTTRQAGNTWEVSVPDFPILAVLRIEL
ncbi:MAG: hypothetical protein FJ395_00660 [Verrucomicrobia bacterium]|nr:hypothetical protein [Verrucomicrobiota bacterium]